MYMELATWSFVVKRMVALYMYSDHYHKVIGVQS